MSIYVKPYKTKKGKTKYMAQFYLGIDPRTGEKKQTTRRGFSTAKEAKSEANRLIYEFDKGELTLSSLMTYEELYNLWIESYRLTVEESTFVKTEQIFKDHILPIFGNKALSKIHSVDCQKFYNGISNRYDTGRMMYNYAKKCYEYAIVPLRQVKENPFAFVERTPKKKKEKSLEKSFLELREMIELLELIKEETKNPLWYVFFSLLGFTGLRKSEALALTWSDIDFQKHTLRVNKALSRGDGYKQYLKDPKTFDSNRIITLTQSMVDLLELWKHIQAEVKIIPINSLNLVFPSSKGTHIQNTAPDKPLERVITKHNFKKITPHGFRHSHCCHLFDAGASIKEVMDRLGHKDISVTMDIYNHVTEFRKKDTLVKYEDYLQSVSKVCQIK